LTVDVVIEEGDADDIKLWGETRQESGARIQAGQRRRCRCRRRIGAGGLIVQFCSAKGEEIHNRTKRREESPTLQTTRPHLRHSETISLAHEPTLPVALAPPSSTKYQSAALALYRSVCSLLGMTSSLQQRRVLVINCLRNCRRFSRV